jgi:hypothetical protein
MRKNSGIAGMNESGFKLCRDESERAYAKQGCLKAV